MIQRQCDRHVGSPPGSRRRRDVLRRQDRTITLGIPQHRINPRWDVPARSGGGSPAGLLEDETPEGRSIVVLVKKNMTAGRTMAQARRLPRGCTPSVTCPNPHVRVDFDGTSIAKAPPITMMALYIE